MSAGLVVLLGGILVAIACVAFGAVGVVSRGLRLKKRLEGYKRLPILDLLRATQARVSGAERRIDSVPALLARADAALGEFAAARLSLIESGKTTLATVRALPAIVIDNLPALFATKARTPES